MSFRPALKSRPGGVRSCPLHTLWGRAVPTPDQSAIDWAEKTLAEPDQDFRDVQANLVLAMALQQCGKLAKARAALDNGARGIESQAPKPGSGPVDGNWPNWIIARALLEEAKGLIEGVKPHSQ